jgi:hypothetical protein
MARLRRPPGNHRRHRQFLRLPYPIHGATVFTITDNITGIYFDGGRQAPACSLDWHEDARHAPLA